MAARGRRIKRRGSGRSSCDGDEGLLHPHQAQQPLQQQPAAAGGPSAQTEPSTVSGNSVSEGPLTDGAEDARMHQLLEAQKRAFEVGLPCLFCVIWPARMRGTPCHMHACLLSVGARRCPLSGCMRTAWPQCVCLHLCPQARLEEGRKSVSDLARQMLSLQVPPLTHDLGVLQGLASRLYDITTSVRGQ